MLLQSERKTQTKILGRGKLIKLFCRVTLKTRYEQTAYITLSAAQPLHVRPSVCLQCVMCIMYMYNVHRCVRAWRSYSAKSAMCKTANESIFGSS